MSFGNQSRVVACVVALGWFGSALPARAGGLMLYEVGSQDLGLAAAGYAARAQDAATVLTNPAGMTRLEGSHLLLGVQPFYGNVAFARNANTNVSGGDGGNAVGLLPGGSAFYTRRVSPKLALGIGSFSNFGLGLEYDGGWVGRYYAEKGVLIGLSVMPAAAWRVNEQFSVGAGLNAMYGIFSADVAINNIGSAQPDGRLALEDREWAFGANLGVLFEPSTERRFGLTYSSESSLDFGDVPEFTDLGPALDAALTSSGLKTSELGLGMKVPQTVMASFFVSTSDELALLGNLGWQNWARFGQVAVEINNGSPSDLTVDLEYKDTWHGALGVQSGMWDPWVTTLGMAYDSSPIEDDQRSPTMPLGSSWRFGVGAQKPLNDRMKLGFAYELGWGGTLPMDVNRGPLAGRVAGEYDGTALHFFAINLDWAF